VFHAWVREQSMPELLIDVADYRHVPNGPGVMLIGHEGDYNMDHGGGRFGLRYNRKAALGGTNDARFRQALASVARACIRLEEHFAADGPLTFRRDGFAWFINDRAIAPNTAETLAAVEPELRASLQSMLGHDGFRIEHHADPRARFGVTVSVDQAIDLAAIAGATS
jgi:hypothetical protein